MSFPFSAALRYRGLALVAGLAGLGLTAVGFLSNRHQFFLSYLEGYVFTLAFPMGCLGVLLIHQLTGGRWGWTLRPVLESGVKTVPLMAVLFLPIAFGASDIYIWTNPEVVSHDVVLQSKASYLNLDFWYGRSAAYFLIWIVLSFILLSRLLPSPEGATKRQKDKSIMAGAVGMLLYMLTMSFAAIDWVMTLEPHWFSSIFGVLVITGQGMSAFCLGGAVLVLMQKHSHNPWLTQANLHDIGKFIFMTVLFWAYISLSQFLIIWAGNLPEETFWYHERSLGLWKYITTVLVGCQFVLPMLVLLSKHTKRNPRVLLPAICLIFFVRWLEQIWLVAPGLKVGQFPFHWLDVTAPIGLVGLWLAVFFTFLNRNSGIPAPAGADHGPVDRGPVDQPAGAVTA